MAGYSGTPLAKKLGIKPDFRALLVDVPAEVRSELRVALSQCLIAKGQDRPHDLVLLFAKSHLMLERRLESAARALAPAGMLWIAWPKKSSGVATDLSEGVVRESGLALGLVDVKVCAVTDVWSGLKFVIPLARRGGRRPR
jgi:hypothetical protein